MADSRHAVSASDDQTLRVWDLKNGLQLLSFPDGLQDPELSLLPFPVEFGNDLMQVKILGIMIPPDRTQRNPRQSSSLENEKYFVELGKRKNAVAVMPDGRSVISGSQRGVLQIWDTSCGEELFALIVVGDASGQVLFFRLEGID